MSLARRSLVSISWNMVSNLFSNVIAILRAIILARLLPVEVFGIYEGMRALIDVTVTFTDFGLAGAFTHRSPETEDEDRAAANYFTLKFVFSLVWAVIFGGAILLGETPERRLPFLAVMLSVLLLHQTQTVQAILVRRVVHRRIAVVVLVTNLFTTVPAVWLALAGAGIWAIIAIDGLTALIALVSYYLWKPVWKPRFTWDPGVIRYYLSFGGRGLAASLLYNLLDRVDDLWTRYSLGEVALGYYSRAYGFATRPRFILAAPVTAVVTGTYAELKFDRKRLSQAFFRTNALLIRSGFFMAGLLALVAPEFIRIVLTEKWMPMLDVFRLMLVFTLLDPLKLAISGVLGAVGKPENIVLTRAIMLVLLVAGMVVLSPRWGIAGVAVAVDFTLLVGIAISFWQVRPFVDFSLRALFLVPGLVLLVSLVSAAGAARLPGIPGDDWRAGLVKTVVFSAVYLLLLFSAERQQLRAMTSVVRQAFRRPV